MAKQKYQPGGTIDAVTSAELERALGRLVTALERREVRERVKDAASAATDDATGAAVIDVYQVPLGMEFRLTRLLIESNSSTFAAPFTNANGAALILRNGKVVDGVNLAAPAGIPVSWTSGSAQAPRYRNGEKVSVQLIGGPVSSVVTVTLEGDLYPDRPAASA